MPAQLVQHRRGIGRDHPCVRQRLVQRRLEPVVDRYAHPSQILGAAIAARKTGLGDGRIAGPNEIRDEDVVVPGFLRERGAQGKARRGRAGAHEAQGTAIGFASDLLNVLAVLGEDRQRLQQERVRRADAAHERIVRVRLGEHRHPAPQSVVVRAEARPGVVGEPAAIDRVLRHEVAVRKRFDATIRMQRQPDGWQHRVARVGSRESRRGIQRRRPRERVAVVAPIGCVEIDEHVGIPGAQELEGRSGLRRFGLHVVAIEVEAERVGAESDQRGPVLLRSILGLRTHRVVAVAVVDGRRDDDQRVDDVAILVLVQVPEQRQQRFLSFHLAAVDVALDVDHWPIRALGFGGGANHRTREHDDRDVSPLRGSAHRRHVDALAGRLERIDERHHVRVRRRLREVRSLGSRERMTGLQSARWIGAVRVRAATESGGRPLAARHAHGRGHDHRDDSRLFHRRLPIIGTLKFRRDVRPADRSACARVPSTPGGPRA